MITSEGEQQIGRTPFKKKRYPAGKYRFKIRLYEYKTQYLDLQLKSGMHITKSFKLIKGEDAVNRTEKVDVAPPPSRCRRSSRKKGKPKQILSGKQKNQLLVGAFVSPPKTKNLKQEVSGPEIPSLEGSKELHLARQSTNKPGSG